MSEENILFPRAFRGYERKSVNEFILKINRDFTKESDDLKKEVGELSRSVQESAASLEGYEAQIDSLKAQLAERDEQIEELKKQAARREEESAARIAQIEENANAKVSQAENEASVRIAEAEGAAQARIAQAESGSAARINEIEAETESKLSAVEKERDEICAHNAEEIRSLKAELDSALSRCDLLIEEKDKLEQRITRRLESDLNEYRENIASQLRSLTKNCLKEVMSGVNGLRNDISVVSDSADLRTEKMLNAIDNYEDQMKDEIRKILSDFSNDR